MMTTATRRDMREIILDATERLLARYGYQKMTMDDLAREACIAKRTIYLYFPGKEEVALSSIDRVVERLLSELRAIAQEAASPDARIREMLLRRVLFRFDSVQDYYQSFNDMFAALRPAYMARRERYFDLEAQVFASVLEEGRVLGALAVSDAFTTAQTLLHATNSLLPYSLSARELGRRDEVADRVARVADLLLEGLRKRG
jgi:AcrR family transcriptional regulator